MHQEAEGTLVPPPPELAKIRQHFVLLLEEARRSIASRPESSGSHKSLAVELRISPGRVGEFLNDAFTIEIAEVSSTGDRKLFSPPRLRKSVAGFAASVERALDWLRRQNLLSDTDLDVESVVKSYWPSGHLDEFHHRIVQNGISEGYDGARKELDNVLKIKVERWALAWGPFGTESQVKKDRGFLLSYAKDLITGVDPFAVLDRPLSKSLSEIFDLPARDRKKGLAIATGLCATLYRQFRGFEFITFPIISFPIVALVVPSEGSSDPDVFPFDDIVSGKVSADEVRLAAIEGDMGEALLLSLLASQGRKIDETLAPGSPAEIARDLSKKARADTKRRPLILFSDCIAAFDAFVRLRAGIAHSGVKPISQNGSSPDFSFSLGVMLRKEDDDVARLLEESQRQLFRSSWRVKEHVSRLVDDVKTWLDEQRFDHKIVQAWPEGVPVFQIDLGILRRYIAANGDETRAAKTADEIRRHVEERVSGTPLEHLIGCVGASAQDATTHGKGVP